MAQRDLHVGLVGAGIGGLAAAIAIRLAGARVTVLESASELGEIGAGIQMTPNVSRLLRKWGVSDVIGPGLVRIEDLHLRSQAGDKIGYTEIAVVEQALGHPWWLVHRAHLHAGLVTVARQHGVQLVTNARVTSLKYADSDTVHVGTNQGAWTFDLCIGSDGLRSTVRGALFPDVTPRPPSTNAAYRAIVPMQQVRADPMTRELVERSTMDVWLGDGGYIITYPISGGRDFNLVLSHHTEHRTYDVVPDVPMAEVRAQYKDYDPRIRRVLDMVSSVSRWPLLVTGPLPSWSSPRANVVLMGDAAHSMTNHMAQGAATAMEDGAFLAGCLRAHLAGAVSLREAVRLYEQARMPYAHLKQQVSFLNGQLWMIPRGPAQRARDAAMAPELEGRTLLRSPNLYGDPRTVLEVYGYDAEVHAERVIAEYLGRGGVRAETKTTAAARERFVEWFLPPEGAAGVREIKSKL